MENETLKLCLQALTSRPDAVELAWNSSIGADELTVFCHGSDVSKIVGRGGKTLNALVRLGRVFYAPNRFTIPEVREKQSDDEEAPFTYDQTVALLGEVCRTAFRRSVTVRTEEENVWTVTVDGELSRKGAADTAIAIIDLFEAIGLTIGMRGANRLRVQIKASTCG